VLCENARRLGKPIECYCCTHWPHLLAQYLISELDCDVAVIGIQAADTSIGAPLSPPVQQAVDEIVKTYQVLET